MEEGVFSKIPGKLSVKGPHMLQALHSSFVVQGRKGWKCTIFSKLLHGYLQQNDQK
jgi:hypothetical protein